MSACAWLVLYAALATGFSIYMVLSVSKARREFKQLEKKWEVNRALISEKLKNELTGKSAGEIADYISAHFRW